MLSFGDMFLYVISWGHVSLSYPLRTCFFKLSVGDMFLYVISWGHVSLSYQLGTCFFMLSVGKFFIMLSVGEIFLYVISWGYFSLCIISWIHVPVCNTAHIFYFDWPQDLLTWLNTTLWPSERLKQDPQPSQGVNAPVLSLVRL